MVRIDPRTRREIYMDYLIYGGDLRALPEPITAEDHCWYRLCQIGFGLPQHVNPYVEAVLNSDSASNNYLSTIFDLGETKRITEAKVRFRFTIRQNNALQTKTPTNIGVRLFANNSPGRDIITGGYTLNHLNKITTPVAENEYVIDVSYYNDSGSATNLQTFRYLKPFLELTKENPSDTGRTEKHIIEVHEVSIVIDDTIYNITDTARDFAPKEGSDIKFIKASHSLNSLQGRRSPWYGLKANCLGDSITFGLHPNPTADGKQSGAAVANPWAVQLRDFCGFAHVRNYGLSGNRISGGTTPMHERALTMSTDADVIFVMGATNDLANGVPLGALKADDTSGLDVNTFYGALQTLCKNLKTRFPNKPIIFMTPINGTNQNIPNGVHPTSKLSIEDYRKAIREVVNHYELILFELQDAIEFDAFVEADRTKYIDDGVHPNQLGHDNMAQVISLFLNTQVRPLIAA